MSSSETAVDKARKLTGILSDYVEKMPREIKFTLGDRILLHGIAVMEGVVEAYYGSGQMKIERLSGVNTKLEIIRQILRLLFEKNKHNLQKHEHLNREIDSLGVCIGAWRKSLRGDKP
jgi:hypothetical protein